MWKILFIAFSIVGLYFGFGVASHGGPQAFFAGAVVGCIVNYLWTRYKQEAASNTNTNTQNVNVNLSQNRIRMGADVFSEEQYTAIAEIVSIMNERKLQLTHEQPVLEEITESEKLANLIRRRRANNV